MFKIEGVIKVVKDTVQVTEKFAKREFVITDNSMYPQDIQFQCVQDKCAMLDAIKEGDNVEVSFNLRGREWTSPQGEIKYFNTLDAWRIEKIAFAPQQNSTEQQILEEGATSEEDDDLPF
jgi:hypothetical protein